MPQLTRFIEHKQRLQIGDGHATGDRFEQYADPEFEQGSMQHQLVGENDGVDGQRGTVPKTGPGVRSPAVRRPDRHREYG